MHTKKVYFLIETKKRELNSHLIVIKELIKRDIECYIVSKKQFLSKIDIIKPGVILLKSIGSRNINFIKKLKKNGHKLVCLDSEGISVLHKKIMRDRVPEINLRELDYFFCWGNQSSNILQKYFPHLSQKLITTGNPKFDLMKNYKKNNIYTSEVNEIKKKYGKYILFLTMFTVYNPLKRDGFQNKNQSLETIGFKKDEILIKLGKKFYEFQRKNINFFVNSIICTAKEYKNKLIVVRPHPTEDIKFWERKFFRYKNIKVVYDNLDTVSWLIGSEKNLSINCTTSLESFLLNKISLNLVKYSNKNIEYHWILGTSKKINSIKALMNEIRTSDKIIINKKYELKKYLYNFKKDSNSAKLISTYISKICFFSQANKRHKFRYLKSKIYASLKNKNIIREDKIYAQKIGSIIVKDIEDRISLLGADNKIKIREFYPDYIKINKKN